jgi:hypothetical protein
MKKAIGIAATALAGWIAAGGAAHACGTGPLLYQDKFQTLDPAWNAGPNVTASSGAMDITIAKGSAATLISQANLYNQPAIEICATVKMVSGPGNSGDSAVAGLLFWSDTPDDYTISEIAPASGSSAVWLHTVKGFEQRVAWRTVPGLNAAVGGTNDLDVVVKGPHAVFSANGKPAVVTIGIPPASGWMAGMHLEAPGSGPTEWQVTDFEVRVAQ